MTMKQVSKYETTDGRLFDYEIKAINHQAILDVVEAVQKLLPNVHFGYNDYVQLTQQQYDDFKQAFDGVIEQYHHDIANLVTEKHIRGSIIGRLLDDYDSPAYNLTFILDSIDDNLRWYNQPYYANNPAETVDFKKIDITG